MVERTTHRVEQALPNGGVYTDQAMESLPAGVRQLNMLITYERGAEGGYPKFQMQWGTDEDTTSGFSELIRDLAQFVGSGAIGSAPTYIEETYGPVPQSASPLKYTLTFTVPYGATKFRLIAAEQGVTGTQGTLTIEYVGGTGEG
jgi:hypothetical protein